MHLDSSKMKNSPAETFMIGLRSLIDRLSGEKSFLRNKNVGK